MFPELEQAIRQSTEAAELNRVKNELINLAELAHNRAFFLVKEEILQAKATA